MIKARHNYFARMVFNPYLDVLFRKHFSGIFIHNAFPRINSETGLIVTPNHFSWWDGFFIDYIARKCIHRRIHILMLEEQLKRYWFFRYLGAYSINDNKPKSIIETAQYTANILMDTKNFSVYYPQGRFEPYDKRPLELKDGLLYFLRKLEIETYVVPAAFKIINNENKKPSVNVRFGQPIEGSTLISCFDDYKKLFNNNLISLDNEVLQNKQVTKV